MKIFTNYFVGILVSDLVISQLTVKKHVPEATYHKVTEVAEDGEWHNVPAETRPTFVRILNGTAYAVTVPVNCDEYYVDGSGTKLCFKSELYKKHFRGCKVQTLEEWQEQHYS